MKTASGRDYDLVPASHPGVSMCFHRGFLPVGDSSYIDSCIIGRSDIGDSIAMVPEIEQKAAELVERIVQTFVDNLAAEGALPGQRLQNMATWMVAWSLEMAWCWSTGGIEECSFSQNMSDFQVPKEKFALVPNPWVSEVVTAFMEWCYGNPGYTERHGIDMYDPLRDGYLTIARVVVTKVVPFL
jgi:hypothetical protein